MNNKENKSEMATPRKPSDEFQARPRRAIPMTFAKEIETMRETNKATSAISKDGLFGLVVAGIAAAVSVTAIITRFHMSRSTATIESGGPAFSANFGPAVNSLLGLLLGFVAFLMIAGSLLCSEKSFPRSFTFYHLCSLILLLPSSFILIGMFT